VSVYVRTLNEHSPLHEFFLILISLPYARIGNVMSAGFRTRSFIFFNNITH